MELRDKKKYIIIAVVCLFVILLIVGGVKGLQSMFEADLRYYENQAIYYQKEMDKAQKQCDDATQRLDDLIVLNEYYQHLTETFPDDKKAVTSFMYSFMMEYTNELAPELGTAILVDVYDDYKSEFENVRDKTDKQLEDAKQSLDESEKEQFRYEQLQDISFITWIGNKISGKENYK